MNEAWYRRIAAGAESGLRRYPRHLLQSVREGLRERTAGHGLARPVWADGAVGEAAGHPGCQNGSVDIEAMWIGHATVLIRVGGVVVLTDPVFSKRIGMSVMSRTLGLARLRPPAVKLDDLPPVDVVLVSHAHFDHLDKPSLNHLVWDRTVVVTATRTRKLAPGGFGEVVELGWGERFEHKGVTFTAYKPEHWGARTAADVRRGYNSYAIESPCGRVFYAGDTADTDAFDEVTGMDLAIFGIGAYNPWVNAHATPEQVWQMFTRMGAKRLMPIHHSTFELGREPHEEPMDRLRAIAGGMEGGLERVVWGEMGERLRW